jgi:GT2 family glycosyltransferase
MELQTEPSAIPSGWVLLRCRLSRRGQDCSATLFAEVEGGAPEACSFPLPASRIGWINELLYLPGPVTRLLLEPMRSSGECELIDLQLVPVGPVQRIAGMWRRVLTLLFTQPRVRWRKAGLRLSTLFLDLPEAYRIAGRFRMYAAVLPYDKWADTFSSLTERDRRLIGNRIARWSCPLCVDVVVVADQSHRAALHRTLDSLEAQLYRNFRAIVLMAGCHPETERLNLPAWVEIVASESDLRAVLTARWKEEASLVWTVFMPPGAGLAPHALYWIASEAVEHDGARLIYCDHDYCDEASARTDPMFKPDWSPELLRSTNYIGCSYAVHAGALVQAGGFSLAELRGENSHDLLLRVGERLRAESVRHIPAVLWHLSASQGEQHRSALPGANPVTAHLARVGVAAAVEEPSPGHYRVRYRLPSKPPLISIIVPTRDALKHLNACVESVLGVSSYGNFELIVVDNQSVEPQTLAYLDDLARKPRMRVIRYAQPFNYSAINNYAVNQANGEVLCLLNNDTEVISPDWMEEMLGHLVQERVGIVGAKLYYPDGRVQHAGDVVGVGGIANHLHASIERDHPGYGRRAVLAQELSAVTGACLMTWRSLYLQLGGLNELRLPVAFNDVDYCLRVWEAGYRVIWTPYAELCHHESLSRGGDLTPDKTVRARREAAYMRSRWKHVLQHDPFYNPNFSYNRPDFSLSHAPIVPTPW